MKIKVTNCCFFVELRKGCIIMAVVGIVLSILGVDLSSGWSTIHSLISSAFLVAFPANCCLLYSAAYTKGSIKSRSISAFIYIIIVLVSAIFLASDAIVVLFNWIQSTGHIVHGQYVVALVTLIGLTLLDLYFILVAISWDMDLKGKVVVIDARLITSYIKLMSLIQLLNKVRIK